MHRQHRPCALIASAGLLISAHAASAQFDTFTGDIQLDGVPVVSLGFDFMGTLALASIANPVDVGGFDAELAVTPGATITHTGDLLISPGLNTSAIFRLGSGASWTTTGTLDHGSGTNLSGRLNLDTDASLTVGGDFVMANNPGSGALFEALAGSSTSIGGDFTASAGSDAPTFFTIEGAGATLDIAGSFDMGSGDASFGNLDVFEGAVGTVGGDFTMGSGSRSTFRFSVEDGTEFHIGGHAAFGQGSVDSTLDISINTASTLTSGSMSISGRSGSFGSGAELTVDNSSSLQTGALTISEGAKFNVRSGSTVIAGATRLEGDPSGVNRIRDSSAQFASLTIADRATLTVNQQSSLQIDGPLTFEVDPNDENPPASLLNFNNGDPIGSFGASLRIEGGIEGDRSKLNFVSGIIEIGTDFVFADDLDDGFLSLGNDRILIVDGHLDMQTEIQYTGRGAVSAGSIRASDIDTYFGNALGTLSVGTLLLDNEGQTTTAFPTFTSPVTLDYTAVQNDGLIEAPFINANSTLGFVNGETGEIRIGEGDSINPARIENHGRIELIGRNVLGGLASIDTPGTLENGAGGVIFAQESEVRTAGGFTNDGTLGYTFGRSSVFGEFDNTGLITITGDSQVTFFDDVSNNGTINLASGGTFTGAATVFGTFSGAGNVSGGGDLFLLGDVQVGNSPAAVAWDASLFLGPTSDTLIEIAGTEIGDFDRFSLTGDLGLAGDLEVTFLDGFLLAEGMRFSVFNVQGTKSGTFDGLVEGDLVGTYNGIDLFITYDNNGLGNVALFTVPAPGAAVLLSLAGVLNRRRRA